MLLLVLAVATLKSPGIQKGSQASFRAHCQNISAVSSEFIRARGKGANGGKSYVALATAPDRFQT
jgi:hypothetical protein